MVTLAKPRLPAVTPRSEGVARDGSRPTFVQRVRREFGSFATIGVVCTLLFVAVYHTARTWLPPLAANGFALTATAGLNFAANRWFTFQAQNGRLLTQGAEYFFFYVVGLAISSAALSAFLLAWSEPPHDAELIAALMAGGLATAVRYVAMTLWVFREA
jgi:putative flippase GtrA